MFEIPKPEYTLEFRDLSVKRVKSGQTIGAVAPKLGLVDQKLSKRIKAAERGKLNSPSAKVATPEQMELQRLRAENDARRRMECENLKKATAYFAKDTL